MTEKNPLQTSEYEPEKVQTYVHGDTVFKVCSFFKKSTTETLRDILERSIRREAKAQLKS